MDQIYLEKIFSCLANEVCMFVELEPKEKASKGISILERIVLEAKKRFSW